VIFTVPAVCLEYCLGIIISTAIIRSMKIVGTGFFWLMNSIALAFAFLTLISSHSWVRLFSILIIIALAAALAVEIKHRATLRNITIKSESFFLSCAFYVGFIAQIALWHGTHRSFFELVRLISGSLALGSVTTAMLLGHWYLVQPGLNRVPISRMTQFSIGVVLVNIVLWLIPTSMLSVIRGTIDDGWSGTLGYMWVGSAVTTLVLLIAAYKALQEKSYTAVMATTGLLYLAILVVNGAELIPRAIFS
jgi:hypothetical protein